METLRKRLERGLLDPEDLHKLAKALANLAWEQHSQDLPFGPFTPDEILWDGSQVRLQAHSVPRHAGENDEDQKAEEDNRKSGKGEGWTHREDIRWIGALLFWAGTTESHEDTTLLPTQLREDLPPFWDGIISNCLHENPLERFAHAGDLLHALQAHNSPAPTPPKKPTLLIPLLLFALLATYLLGFEIHDHGRTYDDLVQRGRGEAMLDFFSTWNPKDLPSKDPNDFTHGDRLYGPFAATLSVWIGQFISPWIGDPTQELHLPFHAGLTLFGLLWVLCCYFLALRVFKRSLPALTSTLLLLALPRVFGQLTSNPSDLPAASLMALSAVMMFRWFDKPSLGRTIFFAIALAALGATRMQNGGLMAAICLPPIFLRFFRGRNRNLLPLKQIVLLPLFAWAFFILFWPDFWFSPLTEPIQVLRDFFHHKSRYTQGSLYFGTIQTQAWTYPLVLITISTPLSILALFLLGLLRKTFSPIQLFLGLWLLLSIGKHFTGIANHGGIRHFLDAYVPLALFAGMGLHRAMDLLGMIRWRAASMLGTSILLLSISLLTHPFESSYYNLFVGGIPGAVGRFDLDSNGSSFLVLMKGLRPQLKNGDFLFIPGSMDLVVQVPLPKDCPVLALRPNQAPLLKEAIKAGTFKNRRCILLFHQGVLWGSLDELIHEKKLKILFQTGPKGLPLSMALLVPDPKNLLKVLEKLKTEG